MEKTINMDEFTDREVYEELFSRLGLMMPVIASSTR